MTMTITEEILAKASGRSRVLPGELIICPVNVVCIDEIQIPIFMQTLEEMGNPELCPDKIVFVIDHYCPPTSLEQARSVQMVRDVAFSQGLTPLEGGIKHQLLMENGFVKPGSIIAATDSHINMVGALGAFAAAFGPAEAALMAVTGETWFKVPKSIKIEIKGVLHHPVMARDIGLFLLGQRGLDFANYKAIEFCDQTAGGISIDGRITLCNLTTEMGAKSGIFRPDRITGSYLDGQGITERLEIGNEKDAAYVEVIDVDVTQFEPLVAEPHSPSNVSRAADLGDIKIEQAFIGSCIGGNMDDLRAASMILKRANSALKSRLLVTPASRRIYLQALSEGLIEIFLKAGSTVSGTTCSACIGLEAPLLPGQRGISTSTRNFRGRMGSPESFAYLASAATVAASAITGKITDPREFM